MEANFKFLRKKRLTLLQGEDGDSDDGPWIASRVLEKWKKGSEREYRFFREETC